MLQDRRWGRPMLSLLNLPITLLRCAFYALCALFDALSGRNWLRVERAVQIGAPRDVVWRFVNADRVVFDGPPLVEIVSEPLPEDPELRLVRYAINGHEWFRVVVRQVIHDEAASMVVTQQIPHELTWPREFENDSRSGVKLA